MDSDWGWWAGRDEELFTVGPCPTKEEAIKEAFDSGSYYEIEIDGVWHEVVHYAECCGLYFDCDECGIVPEACDGCKAYLSDDESASRFSDCRNWGIRARKAVD